MALYKDYNYKKESVGHLSFPAGLALDCLWGRGRRRRLTLCYGVARRPTDSQCKRLLHRTPIRIVQILSGRTS